ncbi:MAG: hypothetical protein GY703_05025 [Gammaproteobacteria bacterium]|nr:hypothetical protein [Gammaproteobacteria bacterium]
MTWTSPRDLHGQLQRVWDRGEILTGLVTGESVFPRRLTLKGPTSSQMAEQFDDVRAWIQQLRALPRYRIEMRKLHHRQLGKNQVPGAVWVDSLDDVLDLLGKRRQANHFAALVEITRKRQPLLLDWMAHKPHKALELEHIWNRLLDVVDWMVQNPRSGVYLRQVDIPGIHSKFIEANRGLLTQWLDRILPAAAVHEAATGVSGFSRRYGFREKPQRIRLRALDPVHGLLPRSPGADITLDGESFKRLDPNVSRVFITENEINYLVFPPVPGSLLIFGAGYGFDVLSQADWLKRCRLYYWGDIDTHGFSILDQLRACYPEARSMLMDRTTLLEFRELWGREGKQVAHDLPRLNPEERALYDELRMNRLAPSLRLEQERISFGWVEKAIAGLTAV